MTDVGRVAGPMPVPVLLMACWQSGQLHPGLLPADFHLRRFEPYTRRVGLP